MENKMKSAKFFLLIGLLAILVSCNDKDESVSSSGGGANQEQIKAGVLDGVVKGDSWTFMSGRAKKSFFKPNEYSIDLWESSEADPCQVFSPSGLRSLLTTMPIAAGTYALGERTLTFSFKEGSTYQNLIATQGSIVIEEVSGDTLKGKLVAGFDNKNSVNGAFSIPVCD